MFLKGGPMDFKQIQTLIKEFEKSTMTVLEIESEGFKIKLNKNKTIENSEVFKSVPTIVETVTQVETTKEEPQSKGFEVKSPLVGTFYEANSPKDKPFVQVGQRVEKGQTLCIIEAMKIMNEITAPVSGVIESIKVKNGSAIGFDQILMVIA